MANLVHEIIMEIQKKEIWDKRDLLGMINKKKISIGETDQVSDTQKYDIFSTNQFGVPHPAVVIRKGEKSSYAIVLSTKEDKGIYPYHQRGFKDGYFTSMVINVDNEYIRKNWMGIFQDRKSLRDALTILRGKYKSILSPKNKVEDEEQKGRQTSAGEALA